MNNALSGRNGTELPQFGQQPQDSGWFKRHERGNKQNFSRGRVFRGGAGGGGRSRYKPKRGGGARPMNGIRAEELDKVRLQQEAALREQAEQEKYFWEFYESYIDERFPQEEDEDEKEEKKEVDPWTLPAYEDDPSFYGKKYLPCRYYFSKTGCKYGDKCQFRHDEGFLCKNGSFLNCPKGGKCYFVHDSKRPFNYEGRVHFNLVVSPTVQQSVDNDEYDGMFPKKVLFFITEYVGGCVEPQREEHHARMFISELPNLSDDDGFYGEEEEEEEEKYPQDDQKNGGYFDQEPRNNLYHPQGYGQDYQEDGYDYGYETTRCKHQYDPTCTQCHEVFNKAVHQSNRKPKRKYDWIKAIFKDNIRSLEYVDWERQFFLPSLRASESFVDQLVENSEIFYYFRDYKEKDEQSYSNILLLIGSVKFKKKKSKRTKGKSRDDGQERKFYFVCSSFEHYDEGTKDEKGNYKDKQETAFADVNKHRFWYARDWGNLYHYLMYCYKFLENYRCHSDKFNHRGKQYRLTVPRWFQHLDWETGMIHQTLNHPLLHLDDDFRDFDEFEKELRTRK